METIGFIGGGNMAEALIRGIIAAKLYPPENIVVSDINTDRLDYMTEKYSVKDAQDNTRLARLVDVLVLSVKPQNMAEALESIKGSIVPETLIISIAAGVKTTNITDVLGNVGVIRVMPNTPALIGQGASALYTNDMAKLFLRKAERIFASVGVAVFVDDENLIDSVTAVSGSGPAYYFLLIEEMIKAAKEIGLSEDVAKKLVIQTAKGAALLAEDAEKQGQGPAELREKVTSPGGTTEAALKIFTEAKFSEIISTAIKRACQRSKELSD